MNTEIFERNSLFWGEENQQILANKNVAVFGLGGVGGFCVEALARAGIGNLTLVDFDRVSQTNLNRQIIALNSTISQKKTELFEKRLRDINQNLPVSGNEGHSQQADARALPREQNEDARHGCLPALPHCLRD